MKTITSSDEYIAMLDSEDTEINVQAAYVSASEEVWYNIIASYPEVKKWVINNKTVPHSILEYLANDPDDDIRRWVARKRKANEELLLRLATDPSESVRLAVAFNQSTPRSVLDILVADAKSNEIALKAKERIKKAGSGPNASD